MQPVEAEKYFKLPPASAAGVPMRGISEWATSMGCFYLYIRNGFSFVCLTELFGLCTCPDYIACNKAWQDDLKWKIGKTARSRN
jgi:hypothetical protein